MNPWARGFNPWPRSVGQGPGAAMNCGVGHRCGSDLALLWLWGRPAPAALIPPLAWELPYATYVALKSIIIIIILILILDSWSSCHGLAVNEPN